MDTTLSPAPFLFIIGAGPYAGQRITDALNLLVVLATYDLPVTVVLEDQALWLVDLHISDPCEESMQSPFRSAEKMMRSLELYDIEDIRYIAPDSDNVRPTGMRPAGLIPTTYARLGKESFRAVFRF